MGLKTIKYMMDLIDEDFRFTKSLRLMARLYIIYLMNKRIPIAELGIYIKNVKDWINIRNKL